MEAQTPKADKKDTDMRATVNDLVPVFYVLNFLDTAVSTLHHNESEMSERDWHGLGFLLAMLGEKVEDIRDRLDVALVKKGTG